MELHHTVAGKEVQGVDMHENPGCNTPLCRVASFTIFSSALRALKIARALFGGVVVRIRLRPSVKPIPCTSIFVASCPWPPMRVLSPSSPSVAGHIVDTSLD